MGLLKYLSYETFSTKVGLVYALISSLLTGIINHIVNNDGGIDVGVIGLAGVIGGAFAPIALGAIIGAMRKTSRPGAKKSTNIKQSIFYTALVMSFLILFSQVNSDKSDGFYKSDNAILEDIAINNYEAHMCEKTVNPMGLK